MNVDQCSSLSEMEVSNMRRPIQFSCPCGKRLVAFVFETIGEVRFYQPAEKMGQLGIAPITVCPNCQRDFSKVTVEEFLDSVWPC
jgi:hypothetical protein